jgi:hypothetical protein
MQCTRKKNAKKPKKKAVRCADHQKWGFPSRSITDTNSYRRQERPPIASSDIDQSFTSVFQGVEIAKALEFSRQP